MGRLLVARRNDFASAGAGGDLRAVLARLPAGSAGASVWAAQAVAKARWSMRGARSRARPVDG